MTSLFHLTYEGRRYEIDSGTFNDDEVDDQHFTAEQVIVKRCPLFRQAEYVSHVVRTTIYIGPGDLAL